MTKLGLNKRPNAGPYSRSARVPKDAVENADPSTPKLWTQRTANHLQVTILKLAGCDVPNYMDAQTLPGIRMSDAVPRSHVFGMLSDGWMAFDGEWKLAKYASGETLLFNIMEDPFEQRNRVRDPEAAAVYYRLDAELTREIMDSVRFSMYDRMPASETLSGDEIFGRKGWKWDFPSSVEKAL